MKTLSPRKRENNKVMMVIRGVAKTPSDFGVIVSKHSISMQISYIREKTHAPARIINAWAELELPIYY